MTAWCDCFIFQQEYTKTTDLRFGVLWAKEEPMQCWNISKSWGISIYYCTFSFLLTAWLLVANEHICPWWRSALSVCLSSLLLFLSKVNIPVIHFQGNCTNECNTYVMTGQNRKVKVARLLDLRVDRRLLFPRWTKNIPQVMARPSQMPSDADWEVGRGGVWWMGEGGANHGAITQTLSARPVILKVNKQIGKDVNKVWHMGRSAHIPPSPRR